MMAQQTTTNAAPVTSGALPQAELQAFRDRALAAASPEAIFGQLDGECSAKLASLNKIYFKLVDKCHAKHYANDAQLLPIAEAAFQRLAELYRTAQESIRNDSYGNSSAAAQAASDPAVIAVVESGKTAYSLQELVSEQETFLLYRANYKDEKDIAQPALVKIAKASEDNPLLENEQNILSSLKHVSLPKVLEGFELPDGRAATALSYSSGKSFYELRQLAAYSGGLGDNADYHAGWILERQLALLGYLHQKGIVHGSIDPASLIVQGDTHNVILTDFCWAVNTDAKPEHIKIGREFYSAPEVFDKAAPHPAMDIYALGKSVVYLLGGDPESGELPRGINHSLANFIGRMIADDPRGRASDAHQLAYHLVLIRDEISGEKRGFVPLSMNNI